MQTISGKLLALAVIVLLPALPASAAAETAVRVLGGELSGNVTFATDYSFRGYTQTDEGAALQGGLDWAHDSGFYVGAWASNLRWAGDIEIDLYAGYASEVGGISYDIGLVYFLYPNECGSPEIVTENGEDQVDECPESPEADYWEAVLNLDYSLGPIELGAGIIYSPDYWGEEGYGAGDAVLVTGTASLPTLNLGVFSLTPNANIVFTKGDVEDYFAKGEDAYMYWDVGVNVGLTDGLELDLRYGVTDLDKDAAREDWADAAEGLDKGLFIAGLTYSF